MCSDLVPIKKVLLNFKYDVKINFKNLFVHSKFLFLVHGKPQEDLPAGWVSSVLAVGFTPRACYMA